MLLLQVALAVSVSPTFATQPVAHDADDPAIWVHPIRPAESLIIGTDKQEKTGGLYVFNLRGQIVQRITPLDRPNNVDVQGNLVVVTERKKQRLRIFCVDPRNGHLRDTTGETRVFEGETGEDAAPMGVGLYRRRDGTYFAIVSPKGGPRKEHLAEYRIYRNRRTKRYDAYLVRRLGNYSGVKETESICVDDAQGFVYYSDETVGTRKTFADPDAIGVDREVDFFNRTGTRGDHEGIALWPSMNAVVCTDQLDGNSIYRVFSRQHPAKLIGAFSGGADQTDGIEICDRPLGPRFPKGIFVAMNSIGRNFLVYDLRDVRRALEPR